MSEVGRAWRPHPRVVVRGEGDGAIALHLGSQQYFELNATARFVWDRLVAGASPEAVAAEMAETWALAPSEASEVVHELLAELEAEGLLVAEGGDRRPERWWRRLASATRRRIRPGR